MAEAAVEHGSVSPPIPFGIDEALARVDWKRHVAASYQGVREQQGSRASWDRWREVRQWLHASFPHSPVPASDRPSFRLAHFEHDPRARVTGEIRPTEPEACEMTYSAGNSSVATRLATVAFALYGRDLTLGVYWLDGFRGGFLIAFADETNGRTTYGGGRYLIDTMKSEDLGVEGDRLVLDFNFAFHPPCFYNPHFSCPLPPPENRLPIAVEAGERLPESSASRG
jgi:hypothetical protein